MQQEPLLTLGDSDTGLEDADIDPRALPVEVIRSRRRKKTSSARIVDGVIHVRIPAWLSRRQEAETVADLVAKVHKAHELAERGADLHERAGRLADRYGLPTPTSIRWVSNQHQRWGSCTPSTGEIRISSRLRRVPDYVLDYVIVHELAHLLTPGHGAEFQALEARFSQRERATGFLEAMGFDLAADDYRAD